MQRNLFYSISSLSRPFQTSDSDAHQKLYLRSRQFKEAQHHAHPQTGVLILMIMII